MKMLVAATGHGPDDFSFVPDDELVYEPLVVCCNSQTCGCNRSMAGTVTSKATTLAKVAELELDDDDLYRLAGEIAERSGWPGEPLLWSLRHTHAVADNHPEGTLLRPLYNFDTHRWDYLTDATPDTEGDTP